MTALEYYIITLILIFLFLAVKFLKLCFLSSPLTSLGSLSAGAIIGIVISVTIIILAVSLLGFFAYHHHTQGGPGPGSVNDTTPKTATGFDNQLYGDSSGKVNMPTMSDA